MITKDMYLMELLQQLPEAQEVFDNHGMGCVQCMGVMIETIENGAKMHGVDLKELLKDLNRLLVLKNEGN